MSGSLQLGVCPNFLEEFRATLAVLGIDDVAIRAMPTTCLGKHGAAAPAPEGKRLSVVCSRPATHPVHPGEEVVAISQCFHFLAGEALVNSLQRAGAFVVSPGWARNWLARVTEWGFDHATACEFFAESMTEVVLLDTGVYPEAREKAVEFAAFVGLPLRTLHVGLDHLRAHLTGLVAKWRLTQEQARHKTQLAASQQRLAELSMALELLRDLSGTHTEAEAIQRIVGILSMLFAPREVVLLPFVNGIPGQLVPPGTPKQLRAQLVSFAGEVEWLGEDSFIFRLATGSETIAVARVGTVAFPARRDDYLNLARSIAEQCAVALMGARNAARKRQVELELRQSQKLESVGRLASGIAHEINSPVQYVGDNILFALKGFAAFEQMMQTLHGLCEQLEQGSAGAADVARLRERERELDLDFMFESAPAGLRQSLEGLARISTIVRSMKEFAHPTSAEQVFANLNKALKTTIEVARNEYKYVADVAFHLSELPDIFCFPAELNQVFLNLLVNAAHAIGDVVKQTGGRGLITVSSSVDRDHVVIAIKDTGTGIPPEAQEHVFEQFFTTKDVGKGTGQGLSVAWQVVERHGGTLSFETHPGEGTTFFLRLPIKSRERKEAA